MREGLAPPDAVRDHVVDIDCFHSLEDHNEGDLRQVNMYRCCQARALDPLHDVADFSVFSSNQISVALSSGRCIFSFPTPKSFHIAVRHRGSR